MIHQVRKKTSSCELVQRSKVVHRQLRRFKEPVTGREVGFNNQLSSK